MSFVYKIKEVFSSDAKDISILHNQCFDKGWSIESFSRMLSNNPLRGFAVYDNNQMIAFILVQSIVDEAEILTLCTHPKYQRKSIARNLFLYVQEELASSYTTSIFLDVAEGNIEARAAYSSFGFQEISVRKNYYSNGNDKEDAIVMKFVF